LTKQIVKLKMENTLTTFHEEITSQWNIIIHYYKKKVHQQKKLKLNSNYNDESHIASF